MATYVVTASESENWDEDNHFKGRPAADARADELLATHPAVRIVRWEKDRAVKEERIEMRNGERVIVSQRFL